MSNEIKTIYDLPSVYDFPHLKKLMDEMAFDQGAPRSYYYRDFQYALTGWGDTKTVYDVDRLEKLAQFSTDHPLSDVITLEEARAALPGHNDYVNEEFMSGTFYDQLAAGAGEINDVIKTKGDWAYLIDFMDDVFNTYVPDEEKPKQIRLTAERSDVNVPKQVMGFFDTLEQAAEFIDKTDRGEGDVVWPEAFDAIAEMPTGAKMVYVDKWEPYDAADQ